MSLVRLDASLDVLAIVVGLPRDVMARRIVMATPSMVEFLVHALDTGGLMAFGDAFRLMDVLDALGCTGVEVVGWPADDPILLTGRGPGGREVYLQVARALCTVDRVILGRLLRERLGATSPTGAFRQVRTGLEPPSAGTPRRRGNAPHAA